MQEKIETIADDGSSPPKARPLRWGGHEHANRAYPIQEPRGSVEQRPSRGISSFRGFSLMKDPARINETATRMYDSMKDAKPNAGHLAIAELERLG